MQERSSEVSEISSKLSSTHLDKPGGSPALKLPPLFSLTPSSSGKGTQTQKRNVLARQPSQEITSEEKTLTIPSTKDQMNGSMRGISILLFSFSILSLYSMLFCFLPVDIESEVFS
jgi:hypothetical protein